MNRCKLFNYRWLGRHLNWVCFVILVSPIWAYLLGGCDFYFDEERYETVKVSPERLGEIEALDLEEVSKTPLPPDAHEGGEEAAPERVVAPER